MRRVAQACLGTALVGNLKLRLADAFRKIDRDACLNRVVEDRDLAEELILRIGTGVGEIRFTQGDAVCFAAYLDAAFIEVVFRGDVPGQHNSAGIDGVIERQGFVHRKEIVAAAEQRIACRGREQRYGGQCQKH